MQRQARQELARSAGAQSSWDCVNADNVYLYLCCRVQGCQPQQVAVCRHSNVDECAAHIVYYWFAGLARVDCVTDVSLSVMWQPGPGLWVLTFLLQRIVRLYYDGKS